MSVMTSLCKNNNWGASKHLNVNEQQIKDLYGG